MMKWVRMCKSAVSSGVCRANLGHCISSMFQEIWTPNLYSSSIYQSTLLYASQKHTCGNITPLTAGNWGKYYNRGKNACPIMLHNQITIISCSSVFLSPFIFKLDSTEYYYIYKCCAHRAMEIFGAFGF